MAFTPNLVGKLRRKTGNNIYGQSVLADEIDCPFAVVNAKRQSEKTSVRADSSASRGMADEITTGLGCILVPKTQEIDIGDEFAFDGDTYTITSKHVRRSVFGMIDHFECDIGVMPQ